MRRRLCMCVRVYIYIVAQERGKRGIPARGYLSTFAFYALSGGFEEKLFIIHVNVEISV